MTTIQILALLKAKFGPSILAAYPDVAAPGDIPAREKHPRIHVAVEHWRPIAEFLRRDPSLQFDWLACLGGIDYAADEKLCVVYDLWSFTLNHIFAVKVFCDRNLAEFPSVVDLWPTANWHEREAAELFGITFIGHPDLRKLLLAEDWQGFPLRKDYVFPREYHGIPGSVELDWKQKAD